MSLSGTFRRRSGVCVEPLGEAWVAFSNSSGQTLLLNDAAAAILEILEEAMQSSDAIAATLSRDSGVPVHEIDAHLQQTLGDLDRAGLVEIL